MKSIALLLSVVLSVIVACPSMPEDACERNDVLNHVKRALQTNLARTCGEEEADCFCEKCPNFRVAVSFRGMRICRLRSQYCQMSHSSLFGIIKLLRKTQKQGTKAEDSLAR